MKPRKPSLNVTILTLFITFLFLTAGSLTFYSYQENSKAAISIADDLLSKVSAQVSGRIEYFFHTTTRLANEVSELDQLEEKPDFMSHPSQWFLAEALSAHPHIYSVYIGYADGDFYQIISLLGANQALRDQLVAPENAMLVIRRVFKRPVDGHRVELWQFLDEERRIVGARSKRSASYDPRERLWFTKAISQEGIVQTPFYIFKSTNGMGTTFANRFDGPVPGVFGVDITLNELSKFFAKQVVGNSGYVFMFNKDLMVSAHPDQSKVLNILETPMGRQAERIALKDADDPLMNALAQKLEGWTGETKSLMLSVNGSRYLMLIDPVDNENLKGQYLAVLAPLSDFTGSMDRTRERSLIFAALIIFVAIGIAMYCSRLISNPLHILAKEADLIRHFNLDSPVEVQSRISEIADLSKAVQAMKMSLSTFGRYVPKTLVKRMLLASHTPKLGGERREATMLFSDIADFTTISESMEAEELMLKVSEYLQDVGSVILEHDGTIDKYIGDAIMAFWNAPQRQENHAALACEAALLARDASEDLNAKWSEQGLPVMFTRFGLHTGNPIIGNVGSEDRMNYTAMGASVNLASRLEGLNKYYGTQILASETVVKNAGSSFLFRSVGKVVPKGTTIPVSVYELLGKTNSTGGSSDVLNEMMCSVEMWEKAYAAYQAQRFDEAVKIFDECAKASPNDALAVTMLKRAQSLAENPPGDDWDGVDVFKTK